jgi:iron-sulfur cluster assembly protein
MLTLTENATDVIRGIREREDRPDTAGLRIATSEGGDRRLSATAADGPERGDEVIENSGARVFLDQNAATMLDDQMLDAVLDNERRVQFVLTGQGV